MSRPRGFIEKYKPQRKTRELLAAINDVLDEYADILPITLRQLFYRLVAKNVIEKAQNVYDNLGERLNVFRRACLVPMDAIRDDGFTQNSPLTHDSKDDLVDTFRWYAINSQLDRQQGQKRRLMLWCEAEGMLPQLVTAAHPYGVSVASSGGFDSCTTKHSAGKTLAGDGALTVMHIGDFDPSGEDMYRALEEDIGAFADHYGSDIEFYRLAVKLEQIEAYSLPTSPFKGKNPGWEYTTQAEALDPRTLRHIVIHEIESRFDLAHYKSVLKREQIIRDEALAMIDSLGGAA